MTTLEYLLSQLAQSAAEVIKCCTKAQMFGLHEVNADKVATGPDNATLIAMKYDDLIATMELLRAGNWIPPSEPDRTCHYDLTPGPDGA